MKFSAIVVFSNIILLVFILLAFFLPFVALGPRSAGVFWRSAWPAAAFLFLILLAMNLFYALNFGFYRLLAREDWPALARYLEKRTIEKGRYRFSDVRLLANTYLLLSDDEAFANLENKVFAANPMPIEKFSLIFGTGRLIRKDYAGAVRFFTGKIAGRFAGQNRGEGASGAANTGVRFVSRESFWLSWYYGLALLFDRRYAAAAEHFSELARTAEEPLVKALAAWFLKRFLPESLPGQSGEFAALAEESRKQVKALLPKRSAWDRKTRAVQDENYTAVISRYLEDTADWLYNPE
ncbi:MAG: hypothetical protein LBF77_02670 [Spirochaetaceae bacterium]|nr:hypothetical protein [Spirochaetaceae bacterium]